MRIKSYAFCMLLACIIALTSCDESDEGVVEVATQHYKSGYRLCVLTNKASVTAGSYAFGPGMPQTFFEYFPYSKIWGASVAFDGVPVVGTLYTAHLIYSDGRTEDIRAPVTGIVEYFPTIVAPRSGSTVETATPTFTWAAPKHPETGQPVAVNTWGIQIWAKATNQGIWWVWDISPTITSVVYNFDNRATRPLESGKEYTFIIQAGDNKKNFSSDFVEFSVQY